MPSTWEDITRMKLHNCSSQSVDIQSNYLFDIRVQDFFSLFYMKNYTE